MSDRLIRLPELLALCGGIGASTVRRLELHSNFPKRLKISTNVVAWRLKEVVDWVQSRQQAHVQPSEADGAQAVSARQPAPQ